MAPAERSEQLWRLIEALRERVDWREVVLLRRQYPDIEFFRFLEFTLLGLDDREGLSAILAEEQARVAEEFRRAMDIAAKRIRHIRHVWSGVELPSDIGIPHISAIIRMMVNEGFIGDHKVPLEGIRKTVERKLKAEFDRDKFDRAFAFLEREKVLQNGAHRGYSLSLSMQGKSETARKIAAVVIRMREER